MPAESQEHAPVEQPLAQPEEVIEEAQSQPVQSAADAVAVPEQVAERSMDRSREVKVFDESQELEEHAIAGAQGAGFNPLAPQRASPEKIAKQASTTSTI